MQYKVIAADNVEEFNEELEDRVDNDWQPHGELICNYSAWNGAHYYSQMLSRKD